MFNIFARKKEKEEIFPCSWEWNKNMTLYVNDLIHPGSLI